MDSVAAAFETNYWPELTNTLSQLTEGDPAKLEERIVACFPTIREFIKRSTDLEVGDKSLMETLEACGWNELDPVGKIAYCAQMNLYFMARFWVACRQLLEIGESPTKLYNKVAEDASTLMRFADQNIDPRVEALADIEKAVRKAFLAGLSSATISHAVASAEVAAAKS